VARLPLDVTTWIETGFPSSLMNPKLEIAPVIHTSLYQLLTSCRSSAANLSALDSAVATSAARESIRRNGTSTLLPH